MIYDFTMPPHKKPGPVNKNRTAVTVTVAEEDINEKKNMLNFNNEILQVLKQVHPNIPITWGALDVMNTIISKMMRRLVRKSYRLNSLSKILMTLLWKLQPMITVPAN
jgi:hypothetical protein